MFFKFINPFNSDETENNSFPTELIESIKLSERLKRIEDRCFLHCLQLKNITIPSSVEYIGNELKQDTAFDKLIMKYMIESGNVSGAQIIHLLYEQEVLDAKKDETYTDFCAGAMSAYAFICNKISNLEITPAQLALDPCEGSVVVTDVKTGEVKALVSYPSYDKNLLTNSVDSEYYAVICNKVRRKNIW